MSSLWQKIFGTAIPHAVHLTLSNKIWFCEGLDKHKFKKKLVKVGLDWQWHDAQNVIPGTMVLHFMYHSIYKSRSFTSSVTILHHLLTFEKRGLCRLDSWFRLLSETSTCFYFCWSTKSIFPAFSNVWKQFHSLVITKQTCTKFPCSFWFRANNGNTNYKFRVLQKWYITVEFH